MMATEAASREERCPPARPNIGTHGKKLKQADSLSLPRCDRETPKEGLAGEGQNTVKFWRILGVYRNQAQLGHAGLQHFWGFFFFSLK